MAGAAPVERPRAAARTVDPEVQQRLQDPEARRAAAAELRQLASSLGQSLRRGRQAEPGQVASLQRAINLYTGSAKLEVDDKFGAHTERALRDVQGALRADNRAGDRNDIGGGRAAAPTLNGLASALESADAAPRPVQDRFQRVHTQPNVADPIGQPREARAVPRAVRQPAPTAPEEIRRDPPARTENRGDPEAVAAARQIGQQSQFAVGFDQPEATALRDRVRGLPDDARPRTIDALAAEVNSHPVATRPQFAANLLTSLHGSDSAELYNRIAPRGNEPGRLTAAQHLDAARAIGTLEGNGREFATSLPRNALDGFYGAARERALSPQGTDADRDTAANLRAEIISRNAEQPVDVRNQGQRDALLADLRFARGGTDAGTASPDDAIARRVPDSAREDLQRSIVRRLESAQPPSGADEARDYRTQLRSVLGQVPESIIPNGLGDRLREPGAVVRGPVQLPGTIVQGGVDQPPARTANAVPNAAELTRLRQGNDPASYQRAVTRVADEVRTNVAQDRARIGAATPTLDGVSPEVLGDVDRHLAGTLATTPDNAGALATVRAAAMRARANEPYNLDTDAGRERLARESTLAFGPDRSRSLSTAFMERNPEDPAHSALPPEARAQLQRDLLARLEPVVGRTANPAVAAALGNVVAPEGELAGRFNRLATLARGGDVTDAAVAATQRGFPPARGLQTRTIEGLTAELDKLDQLGGPAGEDRRAAIDRIARTAMQGPLSRRHEITRDLLATLPPADAARLWEGIRPRRAGDPATVTPNGENRYTNEQLAALGMTIGLSTQTPGGTSPALAKLPPEALRAIDSSMAAGFASNTDRHTMAAAATIRAASLRAQARDQRTPELADPQQASAAAERLRLLSSPRADGGYDERVAAAMSEDVRTSLRNAELTRLRETVMPDPAARRQLAAYKTGLQTALAGAGDHIDAATRLHFNSRLSVAATPVETTARERLAGLDQQRATALTRGLEEWRSRGPDGVADAADLTNAITRELSPPADETAQAATERQRRLGLIAGAGDTATVRDIRAGVDRALVERATAYSQSHLPRPDVAGSRETRPNLPDHQHNELSDALLRTNLSAPGVSDETRFAALHLRMERLQRANPGDLEANVRFAFNLPHTGADQRPQTTMGQLLEGAGATTNPLVAERVQADARRMVAATLRERARSDAEAARILQQTRDALPPGSPLRRDLDGTPTPAPRRQVPAEPQVTPPDRRTPLSQIPHGAIDTQLPVGPLITSYKTREYQYGTQRTIELIRRVAEDYHRETGLVLRVGDISARGGRAIPDHRAHTNGRNIDFDMAFSDGRETAWGAESPSRGRRREDRDATWRSTAYDQRATQALVDIIRRHAPNATIFFNDPRVRGVTPLGNHDNHLHIQGI